MAWLRPAEVKKKYKLSTTTLLDWEEKNLLHPAKTAGGHRRYDEEEIVQLLHSDPSYEGLGFFMKIYFDNLEPLPEFIEIAGATTPDRNASAWLDSPPPQDPDHFYGLGRYERLPIFQTVNGYKIECHPRIKRLATSSVPKSVLLKGSGRNTGVLRFNPSDEYCNYHQNDSSIMLTTLDLLEYLKLPLGHSDELPVFFMSEEVVRTEGGGNILREVIYELQEVR